MSGFLHGKGIELKPGSYTKSIQNSCSILTDAINLGQHGLHRARTKLDTTLDRVRQVVHEKTAPKGAGAAPPVIPKPKPGAAKKAASKPSARKGPARKRKPGK